MGKKVIQLLDDEPIAIYNSIGCAARAVKVKYSIMQDILHGRRSSGTRGYKWRFATEEEEQQYGHFHVKKTINQNMGY